MEITTKIKIIISSEEEELFAKRAEAMETESRLVDFAFVVRGLF